jgi:Bacterial Ig domain
MRTMLRGKISLLFMMLGLLLAIPAVALADIITAASDTVTTSPGIQLSKNLGTVAAGATVTPNPTVDFYLNCNGNNHLDDGQTDTITFSSRSISRTGGGAFSGGDATATNSSVTANAAWPDDQTNCNQAGDPAPVKGGSSTVTITAPTTPGTYTYTINYSNSVSPPDITGTPVATFTLTVPSNTPPVANNDSYNATEDTPLTVAAPGVLGNDTDAESNPLTAVLVSGPSHAAASGFTLNANGSFNYTPAANYFGPDSFTYKAKDSNNAESNTVTVTINVAPVNDAPTCQDVAIVTDEDEQGSVAANCTDVDGDTLTYAIVDQAADGTASVDGSDLKYDPELNFNGSDSFTYSASDGPANSDPADVDVTVNPVNDPPPTPGAISTTSALSSDGTFTLNWGASIDVDGDNVTYTLEKRDADDTNWSPVASGLTSPSYTFGGSNPAEDEGTWDYRVKAVDSPEGAESDFSTAENLVKVDKSGPNAPTLSFATTGQSFKATVLGVDWYKDSAKIDVAANGDPALADTSDGSGVDATSLLPNPFNAWCELRSPSQQIGKGQTGTAEPIV